MEIIGLIAEYNPLHNGHLYHINKIKEKYPNLQLEAQFTGSGAGLEAVASKTTDIGDSSRALTDEEKAKGLEENIVAIDKQI